MNLRLQIDISSLDKSRPSGPIWGKIWLEADEFKFPGVEWWDIAVAVTVELLGATRSLEMGGMAPRVSFFDGPYEIQLLPASGGLWSASLISRNKRDRVSRCTVDPREWRMELQGLATRVLQYCDLQNWSDDDVERLRTMLK